MSDDLVKWLRIGWHDDDTPIWVSDAMTEAAARIEALTAERDRLAHVIDNRESHYGISSNGGMWRFWADEARKIADENKALTAERDRLRAALAFYADEENYKWYSAVDPCGCCSSWYEPKIHINGDDSGQIARAALKGETP